jgi:hypothetical protein
MVTEPILHPDTLRLIAKKSPEYRAAFVEVARCEDAGLPHDDPRSIVAWARFGIAHNGPLLAHAEALLAGGVCTKKGPRAGKPFDPLYRRRLEGWVERLRHILAFHARELRAVVAVRQRFVAAALAAIPQRLARAIASLPPDEHAQLMRKSRAFIVARLKQARRRGSPDAR